MVVDDVHNDTDSGAVKSHNHLLHLANTNIRVFRIGRIRTFGSIVVQRVVAPIVLTVGELGFVDGVIVVGREYVDVRDAELLEVVDACGLSVGGNRTFFGQCKEFTLVGYT